MTPLVAANRLVEFVVWEMRLGDLPEDVREAAVEIAKSGSYTRPRPFRRVTEGPLVVSGFPRDEETVIDRRHVYPHQAPRIVGEMLDSGEMAYVLVSDTSS